MPMTSNYKDCKNYNPDLYEYIELVESGEYPVCKEQYQLIEMVRRELEDDSTGTYVDHERVTSYLKYQKYFPYNLYPWEKFVFILHNCVFRADDRPRWPDLFALMGRGAGKNGYLSFEDFCLITPTNGMPQYDIDICANSEEQAKTSFTEIYNILEYSTGQIRKVLRANFDWTQTYIRNTKTGSTIRYRTNNPKGKDGLRSGKVDFDEPHAYENWDNIKVFTTGLGKKPHPRRTYISTDGDVRDGPLDQMKEKSRLILEGKIEDNGFLPFICKLDSEDEVYDPNMWYKANPSLQYKPDLLEQIKAEFADFKIDPVINSSFLTKRMNIPKGNADAQVTSWENILKTNREMPDLEGKMCIMGVDYTKTTDFMSAVLLFRDGETYYVKHHSWFCTNSSDRSRIKIPLDEMVQRGILTMVDDVEINPALIAEWADIQRQKYIISKIAIDSYRYTLVSKALESVGFSAKYGDIVLTRPSDIMRVSNQVCSLFQRGLIVWGDDPLMRWYTNNAKLEPAPNNNYKFGKIDMHSRKTDGFMAFVHALSKADDLPDSNISGASMEFFEPLIF